MDRSAPDHGADRRHLTPRLFHDRRRLRIGLFGGSFNPAHEGHLHLSDLAQRQLRLDELWWLVSPQNPLKDEAGMARLPVRLAGARRLVSGRRRVRIIAPEVDFRSSLTFRTLQHLRARCPGHSFIWLMGADNLVGFANWQRHDVIAETMPIAVIDRPGYSYSALKAGAALLRHRTTPRQMARNLALSGRSAKGWCFIAGRRHHASATALRQARQRAEQQCAKLERND
ncbi:nicotinate-nucleotide adenylyltransferase [Alphaproteobacteria bacterium LSUCC0719]